MKNLWISCRHSYSEHITSYFQVLFINFLQPNQTSWIIPAHAYSYRCRYRIAKKYQVLRFKNVDNYFSVATRPVHRINLYLKIQHTSLEDYISPQFINRRCFEWNNMFSHSFNWRFLILFVCICLVRIVLWKEKNRYSYSTMFCSFFLFRSSTSNDERRLIWSDLKAKELRTSTEIAIKWSTIMSKWVCHSYFEKRLSSASQIWIIRLYTFHFNLNSFCFSLIFCEFLNWSILFIQVCSKTRQAIIRDALESLKFFSKNSLI